MIRYDKDQDKNKECSIIIKVSASKTRISLERGKYPSFRGFLVKKNTNKVGIALGRTELARPMFFRGQCRTEKCQV
jgi:hypothetical protein